MSLLKRFAVLIVAVFVGCHLMAQISLSPLFADNMVLQQNASVKVWGWAKSGEQVSLKVSWSGQKYRATADSSGAWQVIIQTPAAGGPYEMSVGTKNPLVIKNILIGEVWLCTGQSNMEMPVKGFPGQPVTGGNEGIINSSNDQIRVITVERSSKTTPQVSFKGSWQVASPKSIAGFSASGYFFGQKLNKILNVPVGLINCSYGGSCIEAWMSHETSQLFENTPVPSPGDSIKSPNRTPTVLFNGMLNPIIGYGIRGAIWYQGESNYKNGAGYESLLKTMVQEWRTRWAIGEFPFFMAQIAPYDYHLLTPADTSKIQYSAYLREAQLKASQSIANSGLVVLLDVGDEDNIHPTDKQVVGNRFANMALAKTYGLEGFGFESPTFDGMEVKDSLVTVSFNNVPNGITSYGKEVTLFEVAGNDHRFYRAKCVVRRKSVVLSSDKVAKPVAIRYAFKDFVVGEIFSTEGLPLSSFRTDDWNP